MKNKLKHLLPEGLSVSGSRAVLLTLLPFFFFLSYHPLISFGQSHGMHFELSFLEIYLALFVAANLPAIYHTRKAILRSRFFWLIFAFCAFNSLSLFWTTNFVKGLLISAMLWLLCFCFMALASYGQDLKKLAPIFAKSLIVSSILFSVFALFQFFGETFGLSQSVTLLCDGCLATQLGFPRVTGFSIEPQFFANILLAPIFLLFARLLVDKKNQKNQTPGYTAAALLLVVFFLTLSRGAIYALIIGLIVLAIIFRKRLRQAFTLFLVTTLSFLGALGLQGFSAAINPHVDDDFYSATTRIIHQLSLGIIDIRPSEDSAQSETENIAEEPIDGPVFDGYIEESTNDRMLLSRLALQAWLKSPVNFIFGTGVGSTGYILAEYFPDQTGNTEITQNQYAETLLENGVTGIVLLTVLIVLVFLATKKQRYLWPIFIAFLAQWLFFSGLPNALHLYLFVFVCLAALNNKNDNF